MLHIQSHVQSAALTDTINVYLKAELYFHNSMVCQYVSLPAAVLQQISKPTDQKETLLSFKESYNTLQSRHVLLS